MSSPTAMTRPTQPTPHLRQAFGGVWRLTFRNFLAPSHWLGVLVLLVLLGVTSFAAVRHGVRGPFFGWTTQFYLVFLIPILAFLSGSGAMMDEMKPVAIDYVLTRPVRRPALVCFKFLSHLACAQVSSLLALTVVVGVGVYRDVPGVLAAVPLLLLTQVVASTVFTALGFFFAAVTMRYLVLGLAYAAIIEIGIGNIPTQLSRLSLTHHLKLMLHPVQPDFARLLTGGESMAGTVTLLLAISAALVVAAAAVFHFREFAGSRPKDA